MQLRLARCQISYVYQGWTNEAYGPSFGPFGGMGFQEGLPSGEVEPTIQELGMPVMEIFVRRDSSGLLQRQACVVREANKQPSGEEDQAKAALDLMSPGALHPPLAVRMVHLDSPAMSGTNISLSLILGRWLKLSL